MILGALATLAAAGEGGGLHDGSGVVRWIMKLPAGAVLVGLSACGFAGYALYCAALACFGEEHADSKLAAVMVRLKGVVGFLVYGSLTLTSVQLLMGHHAGGGSTRIWIAQLLAETWGRVVIGLLGAGFVAFGVYQCRYAAGGKHRDEVNGQAMSSSQRKSFLWIGRIGLTARGIVFVIVGYFCVRAALQAAPSASTGTAEALREIRDVGWVPLAIMALGLAAYGVLQFFYAKYRKVEVA